MSDSSNLTLEKLALGLESNSKLAQALLHEIKESEADFAAVKTELNNLRDGVKTLSKIIQEGNGQASLLTRVALIDKEIVTTLKWVESHKNKHERLGNEIIELKQNIYDIKKRIDAFDNFISEYNNKKDEEYRQTMDSIQKDKEIEHVQKKNDLQIRTNRRNTIIGVIGTIITAIVTAVITWFVKKGNGE